MKMKLDDAIFTTAIVVFVAGTVYFCGRTLQNDCLVNGSGSDDVVDIDITVHDVAEMQPGESGYIESASLCITPKKNIAIVNGAKTSAEPTLFRVFFDGDRFDLYMSKSELCNLSTGHHDICRSIRHIYYIDDPRKISW